MLHGDLLLTIHADDSLPLRVLVTPFISIKQTILAIAIVQINVDYVAGLIFASDKNQIAAGQRLTRINEASDDCHDRRVVVEPSHRLITVPLIDLIQAEDARALHVERQSREGNLSNVQLAVTAVVFDDELLVIGVILLEADIGSQLVVLGLDPVVVPLWLVAAHRTDGEVAEEV
jgi:hypothetical protein